MNIISGTTHNLVHVFKHYVCMRMQFRSSVLKESANNEAQDKRFQQYCATKH